QIALWGEIAFVGMWFILIFSLTMGHYDWKAGGRQAETPAPAVQAEEAARYKTAASNIVARLNAGDYDAIQRRFNQAMSDALPPEKESEFFAGLVTRFGKVEKFDGPAANGYQDWIAFRLHCERGELVMSLA